eukprot:TRINITY_DN6214_c0_g1_i2.p1 TRINITY_DN6214_c0_g1~~TRINITY_DN6214_c0_g1_i2.p1  ORF type:complete len:493 (+),score=103.77 TRINITY_DN6214_c0_g1_i2:209-1480(+)
MDQGRVLWEDYRFDEGIELFRKGVETQMDHKYKRFVRRSMMDQLTELFTLELSLGNFKKAIKITKQIINVYEDNIKYINDFPPDSKPSLAILNIAMETANIDLATLFYQTGKIEKAQELLLQVISNLKKHLHSEYNQGVAHGKLSLIYENLGNYKDAEPHHVNCILYDPHTTIWIHPQFSTILNINQVFISPTMIKPKEELIDKDIDDMIVEDLVFSKMDNMDEEEEMADDVRESLRKEVLYSEKLLFAREKVFDSDKKWILVSEYITIASLYRRLERYDDAINTLEKALDITTKKYGEDHCNVATVLAHIGMVHFSNRKFTRADKAYQKALDIKIKNLGMDHLHVGFLQFDRGYLLWYKWRVPDCRFCFLEAKRIFIKHGVPEDHPFRARVENSLKFLEGAFKKWSETRKEEIEAIQNNSIK